MISYYGNDRNREGYYYNGYEDFDDDMSRPISNCNRFERRHDFSTFNMSDYTSCENCRHLSADSKCIVKADTSIGSME